MRNLIFIVLIAFISQSCNTSDSKIKKEADRIHQKALTLDSHSDTPMWFEDEDFNFGENNKTINRSKIDIPRMEEGGQDVVFLASFIGQGVRDEEGNSKAKIKNFEIIDNIYKTIEANKDKAGIALNPDDAYRLEKEGKRAFFIGIENGYPLGKDLTLVEENYKRGARYITLCHTRNNDICDSSTDTIEHNGLSDFGISVVKEMNRMGMLIDVSHISDKSFTDVIKYSKAPVIASHSCAKAICDNPRNLSDDLLLKLKENGGVIQMCILSDYVKAPDPQPIRDSLKNIVMIKYRNLTTESTNEERAEIRRDWYAIDETHPPILANVSDVVDHIDHIVQLIGVDYVGIGTDFDGGGGVNGCYDISEMSNITYELVKRGYTEEDIIKIWGGNFMRVFNDAIQFANNSI